MRHTCLAECVITFLVLSLAGSPRVAAQADQPYGAAAEQPALPAQEQPEVMTRGPVHEAFAEPVDLQVQAGLVAPVRPPAVIEEIPPTERPQGDRFVWVPGYWSWDADRNNYIWVSACWRAAPPNMYWVPGYWSQVTGGWEWISGFWTPAGAQEIEYLPAPPASEQVQPPGPPPSADMTWVPSCWYWYQGQYVQRSGYWLAAQPNWMWVPSHYVWTPRGYVFCEGHWDYPLETRGVLFAPVYFPPSVYARSGFSYSPSIVVDLGVLTANLFVYPRYSHYYFGDYYDASYASVGIYPRFEGARFHTWYDPIYEYDRSRYRRTDPRWEEHQQHEYDLRRDDRQLRPARTYREQETRLAKLPESQRRNLEVAQLLTTVVSRKTTPVKFEQINTDARQKIAKQAADVHSFREERTRWEVTPAVSKAPTERKDVVKSTDRKEVVTQVPERKDVVRPTDRKEVVTQPPERKDVVKSTDRKEVVTQPPERKDVVRPTDRKEVVTQPPERKDVVKPTDRNEVVTQPPERKDVVRPTDRKEVVTQPPERKDVVKPTDRKEVVTTPIEHNTPIVPPREVRLAQPERVKIPTPPIADRQDKKDAAEKGPPARPVDEQKHQAAAKDKAKGDREHKSNVSD